MELEALSGLADLLNKTEDAALLRQRLATLKGLVSEHLWDNETGETRLFVFPFRAFMFVTSLGK